MRAQTVLNASALTLAMVRAESFDYVIIGGGTTGLVLANRLSENPNVTVAVIEAGESALNNANSTDPVKWVNLLGSDIDYAYPSTPQAGNKSITFDAGKALGGSSIINGMTYVRAEDVQVDAWEQLGNTGWNWKTMLPYYKLAEHFQKPTKAQEAAGASYQARFHGTSGHVAVGWPGEVLQGHDAFTMMRDTWNKLKVPFNPDPNGGKVSGFSTWPMTANVSTTTRADAARSYYFGTASSRHNLKVFTKTVAGKIVWNDTSADVVANGVVVKTSSGSIKTIGVKKEVILAAGSLRSPLLLEHSGVGNPAILKSHSIPVKLALPQVGENLQDQPNTLALANVSTVYKGYPTYVTFATAQQLFGENATAVGKKLQQSIPAYARSIASASQGALNAKALNKILNIQADLLFNKNISVTELLMAPTDSTFAIAYWPLLPFSRGSVHAQSADSFENPAINPRFFTSQFDMVQAIATAKKARQFFETEPVASTVISELSPGAAVPEGASDKVWEQYILSKYASNSHPIGTLSMMSKELGGVVDPTLKVYGVRNVRVVDASVMPAQTCGHLTSTLYAIAERAADMIKATW